MYNIVKNLVGTGCGHDYATKSGWYIVEDYHDGRVKISEYDEPTNTWGDDITVDYDILAINGEVGSPKKFTEEYEPQVLKEWQNKLYKHLEDVYSDKLNSFDALQAIDFFIDQYDWDIFTDVLKKYNVDYEYVEACPPEDILNNDTQIEYYKTLEDWYN